MAYPILNLGCVLEQLGHKASGECLQWLMQMRDQPGRRVRERVSAKRGRYDPDDMGQYGSATPSEYWPPDSEQATFAVPRGQALRAAKKTTPLSAPGVASGSVAGRGDESNSQLQRSDSRSGFKEEQDRMDDRSGGSGGQSSRLCKMKRSRLKRKPSQRKLPSTSSEDQVMDQGTV